MIHREFIAFAIIVLLVLGFVRWKQHQCVEEKGRECKYPAEGIDSLKAPPPDTLSVPVMNRVSLMLPVHDQQSILQADNTRGSGAMFINNGVM